MKNCFITVLFLLTFCSISQAQDWDRQLLIKNQIVQINEYYYHKNDSVSSWYLSYVYFINDSGLMVETITYKNEPDSNGNNIIWQSYYTYNDKHDIIKDSTIINQLEIMVSTYEISYGKNSKKTIARYDSTEIVIYMRYKGNRQNRQLIKRYRDNKLYQISKYRTSNQGGFNITYSIKNGCRHLVSKYISRGVESDKNVISYKHVSLRRRKLPKLTSEAFDLKSNKYRLDKQKSKIVTANMYDSNDLLIQQCDTITWKKKNKTSPYICHYYEYIKR